MTYDTETNDSTREVVARSARPTRRGLVVAVIVIAGVALSALHGPRSLNAIVLAGGVGLAVAAYQVYTVEVRAADRTLPPDGFPGERQTVRLSVDTTDPVAVVVRDTLPAGVTGDAVVETTTGRGPLEYEVQYEARGRHVFGPTRMTATDVFGLLRREFHLSIENEIVVYPDVRPLSPGVVTTLCRLHDAGQQRQRDEFDSLRAYVSGDPLRDVHWKASAKRDDLVVTEFTGRTSDHRVTVVAGTDDAALPIGSDDPDPIDEMAAAAATVCLTLLDAGIPVTLRTADGTIDSDGGIRVSILEHLATVQGGPVPDANADVEIRATADGTIVEFGDRSVSFEEMTTARSSSGERGQAIATGEDDFGTGKRGDQRRVVN